MTATAADKRARLVEIVKRRSFQEGPEMKLASGKTSTFYFNMKPTMLDPEGAALIAELMLDAIGRRRRSRRWPRNGGGADRLGDRCG